MEIRLASPVLQSDSIVDGEGIRAVLWTQGCLHKCPGCHNPQTHSFDDGFLVDIREIEDQIDELEGQDGITFSGGDPLYQVDACLELAKYIKAKKMNIWCYTGFTFESLMVLAKDNPKIIDIGAGTGAYSIPLANEGYDVTAVELIKHNLMTLRKNSDKVKTYLGNAIDLHKFKDNTFDIVLLKHF